MVDRDLERGRAGAFPRHGRILRAPLSRGKYGVINAISEAKVESRRRFSTLPPAASSFSVRAGPGNPRGCAQRGPMPSGSICSIRRRSGSIRRDRNDWLRNICTRGSPIGVPAGSFITGAPSPAARWISSSMVRMYSRPSKSSALPVSMARTCVPCALFGRTIPRPRCAWCTWARIAWRSTGFPASPARIFSGGCILIGRIYRDESGFLALGNPLVR